MARFLALAALASLALGCTGSPKAPAPNKAAAAATAGAASGAAAGVSTENPSKSK